MELLVIDDRVAEVTKEYNDFACRLKFKDNNEIINVYYKTEEQLDLKPTPKDVVERNEISDVLI